MYIPELLDLSYHRIGRCVPCHLKGISSQGCWMILIGCRTYGYWKSGGWLFLFFWVQKKGICDAFSDVFTNRPPFPCDPRPTCLTLTTLLTLTLTPHSRRTHLYPHLVAVGSVDLTTDNFWIDIADYWLPHWFLNGSAGRQRRVSTNVHLRVK